MMLLDSAQATEQLGRAIAERLRVGDMVALKGDLGAGKTTLARGVIHGLGFEGDVASPTFPIVQPYEGPEMQLPLWHVDLYRIAEPEELAELGLEEARGHAALVIEWSERLPPALLTGSLQLSLTRTGEGMRNLTALVPAAWEDRWPPR